MEKRENARLCSLCKVVHTLIHAEVVPGVEIYACDDCLDKAKDNFIWICVGCRTVYLRSKKLVIESTEDPELKQAYLACMNEEIIQGISRCITCDPEGAMASMDELKQLVNSGVS